MKFEKIEYANLSARQQEIYNFQKIAAVLADYGYNCIKLTDDWQGADFLAYHKDENKTLRVQLKGRLTIAKKYSYKNLYMAFPVQKSWCVIEHDELMALVETYTNWLDSISWVEHGEYHVSKPNKELLIKLRPYVIKAAAWGE